MLIEWRDFKICTIFVVFLVVPVRCQILLTENLEYDSAVQFCPFFGSRRSPIPENKLQECIWYRKSSCCREFERKAYFQSHAKILSQEFNKSRLSAECSTHLGYLMCYVCAPNQNAFFRSGRLSICRSFCDLIYDKCKTSYIDISNSVEQSYSNGTQLCLSRKFRVVDDLQLSSCFSFDSSMSVASGELPRLNFCQLVIVSLLVLSFITNTLERSLSNKLNCLPLIFFSSLKLLCSCMDFVVRICKETTYHSHLSWLGKVALVFVCVQLPLLTSVTTVHILTVREVQSWANALSDNLKEYSDNGMAFSQFKKLYDDVGFEIVNIDPTEELTKIRTFFGNFVSKQQNITSEFVHEVQELHARYQSSGLPKSGKPRSLQDLPQSVYMDSDYLFKYTLPSDALKYDYRVGRYLLPAQSTVKLPDNVQRESFQLIDTVNWTSNLDSFFRRAKQENPHARYLYFASKTGVFRVYPGIDWARDFIGFPLNYEPRVQQWYVSRKTGPKNIVMIIDGSLSMKGASLRKAKSVARIVLNMLNHQYHINVILSKSRIFNTKGEIVKPEAKTSVLGCSKDSVVPASDRNLQDLHVAIQNVNVSGGSDHLIAFQMAFQMFEKHRSKHKNTEMICRNMIIFITDGKRTDGDVRCTSGTYIYMEDNSKKFTQGNICQFGYDYIIDLVNLLKGAISPLKVDIFTFLTNDLSDKTDTGEYLAGRLACENHGVVSRIVDESDYFNQMQPFFNYIEMNDLAQNDYQFLSSCYSSPGDQSAVISMTQPVYTADKEHLGVVGVDLPLEQIESMFREALWAKVHAFIVILTDGSTLVHPLTRQSFMHNVEKSKHLGLYSLETEDGRPKQFSEVMKLLLSRKSGSVPITRNPGRAARFKNFNYLLPTTSSEYFITYIPESEFSIGINVFGPDLTYRKLKEFTGQAGTSYLHTLLAAKNNAQISQLVAELQPRNSLDEGRLFTGGLNVSLKHSVVALSSDSFCNISSFYDQYVESSLEYVNVQTAINSNPAANPCDYLTFAASQDIKITREIEDVWLARRTDSAAGIILTYFLTVNGVMRVFPGVAIPGSELIDMAYQDWYLNALLHRGFLAILGEHPSRHPPTKVVTMSQALLKGDVNCTEANAKVCAEQGLIAVLAIDVRLDEFHRLVKESLKASARGNTHSCGASYICEYRGRQTQCRTKCHLVDSTANFILLQELDVSNNSYLSFPEKYPFILNHLINLGVFVVRKSTNSGVDCHQEDATLEEEAASPSVEPIMGSYFDGPVPPYVPEMRCTQEILSYSQNRTRMSELGGTVLGSFDKDPCYDGQFFVSLVRDTNLFLVVIEGHVDLSANPFNLMCHLSTRALSTYRAPVEHYSTECEQLLLEMKDIETYSSLCHQVESVPLSCGFSDACRIAQNNFDSTVVLALLSGFLIL